MDTALGSFLLLEQIDGNMTQNCKVFRSLIFTHKAVILVQRNVQDPMQFVFD